MHVLHQGPILTAGRRLDHMMVNKSNCSATTHDCGVRDDLLSRPSMPAFSLKLIRWVEGSGLLIQTSHPSIASKSFGFAKAPQNLATFEIPTRPVDMDLATVRLSCNEF